MTKSNRLVAETTDLFSHDSGGWKSETKVLAGLVLLRLFSGL